MLQDILNNPIHECWEQFCEIQVQGKIVPGRITPYEDIVCMTPNHELDLNSMKMVRFWPRKNRTKEDIDMVMDYVANNFKKQAETINKYYNKLCMSLTAGMDSKTTLAAFKEHTSNITFFTYFDPKESMSGTDTKMDTEFVENFTSAHHLKYRRLSLPPQIDETILEICKKNAYRRHLTKVVELYANEFDESYLHIRSNILELIRGRKMYTMQSIPENTPESFLKYRYKNIELSDPDSFLRAVQEFWSASDFENIYDYHHQDLLYWEERLGMWCAGSVLLESDIAFDTYCIFNCRKVLDKVLCAPEFYRKKNFVVKEIIRRLWPELAFQIPNSRDTLLNYVPWLDNDTKQYEKELCSGNNTDSERNVPVYSQMGPYAGVFGFGTTDILEGDFIKLKYYNSFEVGKYYVISLSLVKYAQLEEADFEFAVYAGDLCLYKKPVSEMLDNQFLSMGYVCDTENQAITLCVTNIQSGENKEISCLFYIKDFLIKKTLSSRGKVGYISNQLLSESPKHFFVLKNGESIVDVLAQESRDLKEERKGLKQTVQNLKEERTVLKQENRDLKEERKVLKQDKAILRQESRDLKEERRLLKEERRLLKEERKALRQEKATLQQRVKELENKKSALQNEIEDIRNSTSFKLGFLLTKPFRFIKTKLMEAKSKRG